MTDQCAADLHTAGSIYSCDLTENHDGPHRSWEYSLGRLGYAIVWPSTFRDFMSEGQTAR